MREPGYHPVHAYLEKGPKRPARVRRQTAGRMQALRARQRDAGVPDAATLDRAIADALREAIAATVMDGVTATTVQIDTLIVGTAEQLRARTERAQAAGKKAVVYQREAVVEAVYSRLLAPKSAPGISQ